MSTPPSSSSLTELVQGRALELGRQSRDLILLHELPTAWSGLSPEEVIHALVPELVRFLRLDVASVRVRSLGLELAASFPTDLDVAAVEWCGSEYTLPVPNQVGR